MQDLTKKDKLSILQRLVQRIENWRRQKSLPMVVSSGEPNLSKSSPEFKQWLEDANEGITVVFGEYSHWLTEFKDIQYYETWSALIGNELAEKSYLWKGLDQAQSLLGSMIKEIEAERAEPTIGALAAQTNLSEGAPHIFIGHGRNPLWLAVRAFLEKDCGLRVICFESEPRTSESIVSILEEMLDQVGFAVIVLTAEDATADGHVRARQNVIHEAGLAQGKLGFKKVVILKQDTVEELSNLAGLQYIPFKDRIEQSFYDLDRVLKREGLLRR
jgi:predicted nucleotide-binding protein